MRDSLQIEYVDLHFPGCLIQLSRFITSNLSVNEIPYLFHEHSYYEFHFSPYTCYNITALDRVFPLETDTLLIIPPHLPHFSTCTRAESRIVLNVDIKKLAGDSAFYDFFRKSMDERCLKPIRISDALKECFLCFSRMGSTGTLKNHCALKLSALQIINSLLAEDDGTTPESKKEQLDILLENYVNTPAYSLSQIAENLNYSQRHTARLIYEKYNMSLGDIRKTQTLNTFLKLLDDGYSINAAMALADIEKPDTFRRFFKNRMGVTPREYLNAGKTK